jgi:hypothetical protein
MLELYLGLLQRANTLLDTMLGFPTKNANPLALTLGFADSPL